MAVARLVVDTRCFEDLLKRELGGFAAELLECASFGNWPLGHYRRIVVDTGFHFSSRDQ